MAYMLPWNSTTDQHGNTEFYTPSDLPQLLAVLAMMQQAAFAQILDAITKEVGDAKKPVLEAITYVGGSQCANVKKLVGVHYEQVAGLAEPDVDNLTLNYISPDVRVSYTLSSVARELPRNRALDSSTTLVLFMHGYTDNPDKNNFQQVNNAFQRIGHHNILALDSSPLIGFMYLRASTYVRFIGERLGEALAEMVKHARLSPKQIHLVGHSLGAHICGFAAKRFKELTGKKVARITGLDPAGPCFCNIDDNDRLKKTDAEFVDAIHTDGGVYGLTDNVAQADYFPNGGSQQPNCFFESCSHSRVVALFAESIMRPDGFPALRCTDYEEFKNGNCSQDISLMGLAAAPGTRGKFYLQTNVKEPYARAKAGLVYENRDGIVMNIRNLFG